MAKNKNNRAANEKNANKLKTEFAEETNAKNAKRAAQNAANEKENK